MGDLVSQADMASMLGVGRARLRKWAADGKIPRIVLPSGRFVYDARAVIESLKGPVSSVDRMRAAAPELLAALEGVLSQMTGPVQVLGDGKGRDGTKTGLSGKEFDDLKAARIAAARTAIAKATGQK